MEKERMMGNAQVAKRFLGSDVEILEEKSVKAKETNEDTSEAANARLGEAFQPTVGSTTISSRGAVDSQRSEKSYGSKFSRNPDSNE